MFNDRFLVREKLIENLHAVHLDKIIANITFEIFIAELVIRDD